MRFAYPGYVLPLELGIREQGDAGTPIVVAQQGSIASSLMP